MTFRTNEEVRITGVLGTASNSTVTCSKVINWRDGSGLEYDASWTTATVKIYTSKSNYEYGVCSAASGTLTFTMKGLDASGTKTEVTSNKKQRRPGTKVAFVASASDLVDLDGTNTFSATNTFTDINFTGTTTGGLKVKSLTTTQMNALAAPSNGMLIYNSTTGELYQYIGGAWSAVAAGSTQANASDTVAGKVEFNTTAQSISATDTGETGAATVNHPSDIAKNIQSSTYTYGIDTGGDDTYVVALVPVLGTYTIGQRLSFKVTTANTGACNVDFGPGVLTMKSRGGFNLVTGDILANDTVTGYYDGTNFVVEHIASSVGFSLGGYKYAFGDGSDGDVTINSNTTLTADMFYNNLTINSTYVLSPNGYKIFVKGTLTNNGTIRRNGSAGGAGGNASVGVVGTAGAAGAALNAGTLEDSVAGGAGGIGVTSNSAGTVGAAGTAASPSYTNTDGVAGGNGGDGNNGGANVAGGAGGVSTRGALYNTVYPVEKLLAILSNPASSKITHLLSTTLYKGPGGAGGGASGDAEGTSCSGGGGGGGSAGGVIWIAASILDNTNGVIESNGGVGGAAGTIYNGGSDVGGSGGGGGGNGGIIYLIYKTLTSIGTTTVTGGAGGALSVGSGGGGDDGANGTTGASGDVIQIQI